MTTSQTGRSLDTGLIRTFGSRLRGQLVLPGSDDYDAARQVHNALVDRRPAAIVRAADPADVIRAVEFATDNDLPIAVRSGGHSMVGHGTADGALVVDLSSMKRLTIDAANRVAWAEPGLTAGEYGAKAHEFGLATPFGDAGSVGLGGLTLGGGIGYLVRRYGLTIDNLLSVELVTADGRLVTASADENSDLFWALRGGGGNFGIVTGFQFRLQPVDTIFGGALVLPATRTVIGAYLAAAAAAPDELSMIASIMRVPPVPFVPAEAQGKLAFIVLAAATGDLEAGAKALAPIRALATPIAEVVGPMPYPALYRFSAQAERRQPGIVRSMFTDGLADATIDTMLEQMATASSPMAMTQIRVLGGAMARVPADATAFAHRDRKAMVSVITPFIVAAEAERHEAWTTDYFASLAPQANGVYSNFLAEDGPARIHEAYPGATYERLTGIKSTWDPDNRFALNQNIAPRG